MPEFKPSARLPASNEKFTDTAVVIIGAGISGMCVAIDLIKRNNCRDFVILEKSAGIGGTWYDNAYPGCACDVESILYSYSFAQNSEWTRFFPGQKEILAYLVNVAQQYRLYQQIRFNTTVESATWDDELQQWCTRVSVAHGSKEAETVSQYSLKSSCLVTAVGQLSQPQYPEIDRLKGFNGKVMHSSRWDWTYDLTDKNIALIGNGCSSVQILPEIAKVAGKVTVYQRSPQWITPRQDEPISAFMRFVHRTLPTIQWYRRQLQFAANEEGHSSIVDGDSEDAKELTQMALDHLHDQLPDRSDLWDSLTPKFAIGCKRAIVSDDYYPAFRLTNVELETRPIQCVTDRGVQVWERSGARELVEADHDVIICATGFKARDFLSNIAVHGKNGRSLQDVWKEGPRAYLGTCVDDMPNFAMLYGPNTNLGHNSVILMIEAQSRYINGLLKSVLEARKRRLTLSLCPKHSKTEEYNKKLQTALSRTSFSDPKCSSWYKNEAGLIISTWPGKAGDYQKLLSKVEYTDFEVEGSGQSIVLAQPAHVVGTAREEALMSERFLLAAGVLSSVLIASGVLVRTTGIWSVIRPMLLQRT